VIPPTASSTERLASFFWSLLNDAEAASESCLQPNPLVRASRFQRPF
jgi:hypothetical protein